MTSPQAQPAQTVPMFDPQGNLGDVPYDQMNSAVQAGGKPAVNVLDPQGNHGYVPADRIHDAVAAGAKVLPYEQQEVQHPGFWSTLGQDLKGMVSGLPAAMGAMVGPTPVPLGNRVGVSNPGGEMMSNAAEQGPAAQVVNKKGMEESAAQGDVGGVLGHETAALVPLAAAAVAPEAAGAAGKLTEEPRANFATSRITKLIKPMAGDLKYGAEPAAALPKEGITGATLDELGEKTYARARDVGKTIDTVLQAPENAAKTVDVSRAVNQPIDDAIANAVRAGDSKLYDKLQDLRKQVANVWQEVSDEKGTKSLGVKGPRTMQMTPMEAVTLKRDIADMTRWTGDPMDNEVNAVKARMFGGIKDTVNKAVPDVVELNKRYADLVNAGKAIERRAPVAARSADFSLGDLGVMVAGDALTGSPGVGLAAEVAKRAARNPNVMSRVANAAMPDTLKYEEPADIRARYQKPPQAPPPAPKAPTGGKPPQPERRVSSTPRNGGPAFTDAERQQFLAKQQEVHRSLNPNEKNGVKNPFDNHPSHMETVRKHEAAQDVLSGRKPKGESIR